MNFLYDEIVHARENAIDSCINSPQIVFCRGTAVVVNNGNVVTCRFARSISGCQTNHGGNENSL